MAIRQVVTALGICLSAAAGLLVAVECRAGGIPYAAEPQEDTPAPGRRLYTPNFSPPMTGYVMPAPGPSPAVKAVWKLQAEGPSAIPALVNALDHPEQDVRCAALWVLGNIGDASALPTLSRIALSNDPLNSAACQAVGRIGGPDAATCLLELLKRRPSAGIARSIVHDLGAIGDNRAVEPLIELLKERPPGPVPPQVAFNTVQTRKEAVWALRRFRDPRARAALKNAFAEDPDWGVYHAAHEALRRFDRPDGLDRFGVQLGDFDGQLDDTVILAVEKKPEPPEGAEAYVQRHPPNPAAQWAGPWVEDYAPAAAIDKARAQLVKRARYDDCEVVEKLMCFFCFMKSREDIPHQAQWLIVEIGPAAVPALKVGRERGDAEMRKRCEYCLEAIQPRGASGQYGETKATVR